MDGAEGDGGNGFLGVAEGGGHGGATHGHGAWLEADGQHRVVVVDVRVVSHSHQAANI